MATDATAIGLARLFATYRELKEGQEDTAAFTTLESAERWLAEPANTVDFEGGDRAAAIAPSPEA